MALHRLETKKKKKNHVTCFIELFVFLLWSATKSAVSPRYAYNQYVSIFGDDIFCYPSGITVIKKATNLSLHENDAFSFLCSHPHLVLQPSRIILSFNIQINWLKSLPLKYLREFLKEQEGSLQICESLCPVACFPVWLNASLQVLWLLSLLTSQLCQQWSTPQQFISPKELITLASYV